MKLNPAIQEALTDLQSTFPGKTKITIDEYAVYRGIGRRNASTDLRKRKIPYTRIGRKTEIELIDLAKYKAKKKMIDGSPVLPTEEEVAQNIKRRRGFCQMATKSS